MGLLLRQHIPLLGRIAEQQADSHKHGAHPAIGNDWAIVVGKQIEGAPHEVFLVLDATTGQNAITQAEMFKKTVRCTGIILAKLDGTAKGGAIFTIRKSGARSRCRRKPKTFLAVRRTSFRRPS